MVERWRRIIVLFLLLFLVIPVFSDSPVGSITQIEGSVTIDTFGTGDFITAIRHEVLYPASLVRTGSESKAVLSIGGKITVVPANSKQKIQDLIVTAPREKRFGWVRSLTGAVKSAFSAIAGTKDDVVLGGRASSSESPKVGWISEDEEKDAFDAALGFIENNLFDDAVDELLSIVDPLPGTFLPAEVEFWLGFSYYQLDLFEESRESHLKGLESLSDERLDPWALPYYEQMVFQAGTSSYITGKYS